MTIFGFDVRRTAAGIRRWPLAAFLAVVAVTAVAVGESNRAGFSEAGSVADSRRQLSEESRVESRKKVQSPESRVQS